MTKIIFLFIFPFISMAEMITIGNETIDCPKKVVTPNPGSQTLNQGMVYSCEKNGKSYFVTNLGYGVNAYVREGDKISVSFVSKIETNSGDVLFQQPTYPGFGSNFIPKPLIGSDVEFQSINEKKSNADMILMSLNNFSNDPVAKKMIETAEEFKEKIKFPEDVNFNYDGKSVICHKGKDRDYTKEELESAKNFSVQKSCRYFYCKGNNGEMSLAYIPNNMSDTMGANLLILDPKGSEKTHWQKIKITSNDPNDHTTVFDNTKPFLPFGYGAMVDTSTMTQQQKEDNFLKMSGIDKATTDIIRPKDFIPKKFQDREEVFSFYTNPQANMAIDGNRHDCSDEKLNPFFKREDELRDSITQTLTEEKLTQVLGMVNGNITSLFIPTSNVGEGGCKYNGVIFSPKSWAYFNYIRKLNEHPSEAKPLTVEKAQELFLKAKAMTDLPFDFKYDGCYARAHLMARRFEAMGIPTEKVWIKGDLSVPGTDINWNFHVAPVVTVIDPKTKQPVKYVIDPSLESRAVTLDEWVNTMKKNVKGPVVQTIYPFPNNAAYMQRTAVAISSSDPYLPQDEKNMNEEEKMKQAIEVMARYTEELKRMRGEQ